MVVLVVMFITVLLLINSNIYIFVIMVHSNNIHLNFLLYAITISSMQPTHKQSQHIKKHSINSNNKSNLFIKIPYPNILKS